MIAERKLFATKKELALALASDVAACLSGAITDRGRAKLAVSGGTTPKLFFNQLARSKIDWSQVTITLVDERCVPETDERSNARLVRDTPIAQFVLYRIKTESGPQGRLLQAVLDALGHDEPMRLERHRALDRSRAHGRGRMPSPAGRGSSTEEAEER